jgi:hypothetical protein
MGVKLNLGNFFDLTCAFYGSEKLTRSTGTT